MNKNTNHQLVMRQLKYCLKKLPMKVVEERRQGDVHTIMSRAEFSPETMSLCVSSTVGFDIVPISATVETQLNLDQIDRIIDLLNRVNANVMNIGTVTFTNGLITYRAATHLIDQRINVSHMLELLPLVMFQLAYVFDLAETVLSNDIDLDEVIADFMGTLSKINLLEDEDFTRIGESEEEESS